jgi:nucleoside-diphosphate-sugar epimerase
VLSPSERISRVGRIRARMARRYFVTGATGFIGGRLAEQLLRGRHEVVALVRRPEDAQGLEEMGAQLARGDVLDRDSIRRAMRDVDGVFHLAGWYQVGGRGKRQGRRVNVEGTRNVLGVMREAQVPKGVYTSSLAVNADTHGELRDEDYKHHGPWRSGYDRSKWWAHHEVARPMIKEGLPLVIVMPGVAYGPGDPSPVGAALRRYLRRKLPAIVRKSAYCWAHVDDVAHAHALAMEKAAPGRTYIIAGPPHTMVEAFEIAERITGLAAPRALSPRLVGLLAAITRSETLRVAAGVTYLGSNARARRDLGFDPRPLEDGLRQTLEHEMAGLGIQAPEPGV